MSNSKFKFLVFIDDDFATNKFHEIIVEESGLVDECKFFESPIEALAFFEKEAKSNSPKVPEYIFLDINMPRIDGWEFLERYAQITNNPSSAIIMLSTSLSSVDKNKAQEVNLIHSFINKPLTVELLESLQKEFCV